MALKRYGIWDKISDVICPSGEIFTAAQWIERYPVAALPNIKVVCSHGEINGGFFGTLGSMCEMYAAQGCVITDDMTDTEKLETIEAFEDAQNEVVDDGQNSAEERIAAALEFQNLLALEDVNNVADLED